MSGSSIILVVDSYQGNTFEVETGVQQGLTVSLKLFAIYLSRIFKEVKEEVFVLF